MRLLLDANTLLWWRDASQRLSSRAHDEISDGQNDIVVSVATLWEIAIKRGLGKLKFDDDFAQVIHDEDFGLLAISLAHLQAFEHLPVHHRDPFDRLLIAQALAEGIPIATGDRVFAAYGVQVIW
jgi:PIN domain nuclease of toxin-antitoxin system